AAIPAKVLIDVRMGMLLEIIGVWAVPVAGTYRVTRAGPLLVCQEYFETSPALDGSLQFRGHSSSCRVLAEEQRSALTVLRRLRQRQLGPWIVQGGINR
ncbi:hypothetical protein QK292_18065, partial [Arthrobacter sp. AL08]|uniref:hypothetical protein n=1 Tax=unclassified Arthrobacter TaxID=235627 RepID=UPI00249AA531